jgi:hypothetical protein
MDVENVNRELTLFPVEVTQVGEIPAIDTQGLRMVFDYDGTHFRVFLSYERKFTAVDELALLSVVNTQSGEESGRRALRVGECFFQIPPGSYILKFSERR